MKTDVTLKRHSIQGVEVMQRTSDGYFNITELTKAFNAYFGTNRRVDNFFDNKQTKDFITEIYNHEVLGLVDAKERVYSLTTNEPPKERVHSQTTNDRVLKQRHHCLLSQDTTCVSWSLWRNVGASYALPQIHDVSLAVL